MKRGIGTVDAEDQRRMFCSRIAMSWCNYQADQINGTSLCMQKPAIHRKLFQLVKPVFIELSKDEL